MFTLSKIKQKKSSGWFYESSPKWMVSLTVGSYDSTPIPVRSHSFKGLSSFIPLDRPLLYLTHWKKFPRNNDRSHMSNLNRFRRYQIFHRMVSIKENKYFYSSKYCYYWLTGGATSVMIGAEHRDLQSTTSFRLVGTYYCINSWNVRVIKDFP